MSTNQQRIYQRPTEWTKPVVYKITPDGMWWATAKDQQGNYHSDCFNVHGSALSKAIEYAAGVYQ